MVCDLLVIHIPGLRNVFPGFHSQNLCCRSSCLLIISKAGNILIYLLGNCCRQHSGIRSRIRHQFLLIKLLHDPECFIRTDLKELGADVLKLRQVKKKGRILVFFFSLHFLHGTGKGLVHHQLIDQHLGMFFFLETIFFIKIRGLEITAAFHSPPLSVKTFACKGNAA